VPTDIYTYTQALNYKTLPITYMQVFLFFHGATAARGPGRRHYAGFMITLLDTPHTVGPLWKSDQPDADTST
jgi:hypothetical protein